MIDRQQLLKDLQRLLPKLEKDILAYCNQNAERSKHLKDEYNKAVEAGRTAEHFVEWQAAQITQAAVAWVLICVFIRFMEDNGLLEAPVLSGPVERPGGNQPLKNAKDRIEAYFNQHPTNAERDYLLHLFAQLEQLPAVAELLDHRHNPLWQIPISADGAKELIDFFQKIDPNTGHIVHDFTDPQWDTRFLGDLYQDLSEAVRKRYALLQTPEFVESFILDYTLEPAIATFGLPGLRLIDPTCGSGHFLLTTFERVFDRWQKREPGTNARALAQRALDVVHGTDINPYAIAICRFRLLIAAMKACEITRIKEAPGFHFNLACGDSLLHGKRFEWQGQGLQTQLLEQDPIQHVLEVEDQGKLQKILGQQYHVVVGNPPYITVKDKALNAAYRDKYLTCHMKYSLGAPFTERFFDLTLSATGNQAAGYMGMITTNSFMKREFGKKLIEEFLPRKDLTHVIDTSGAYIPGHGTPTVILFARNQQPRIDAVRAALGTRGEPGAPENAAQGKVWRSIVELLPKPGSENEFISVVDQTRSLFSSHPWSVGGGGAAELKELIESSGHTNLGDESDSVGFLAITGEDNVFVTSRKQAFRLRVAFRSFGEGDNVRDWSVSSENVIVFPYEEENGELKANVSFGIEHFWPYRVNLLNRKMFGKTPTQYGLQWSEIFHFSRDRYFSKSLITFAEVATHNHFVLDRGGKVFKQTAPVIKLPAGATEEQHYALLGLLNSSTTCFWIKQVFHCKGSTVDTKGARQTTVAFENFYQIAGTGLKNFPVAEDSQQRAQSLAQQLDYLAQQLASVGPHLILQQVDADIDSRLRTARQQEFSIFGQMITLQEELDWYVYQLYGLIDEALCYAGTLPEVELGQRAFEIQLAHRITAGETQSTWFERHGSTPITEIPAHWPADYRNLIERRLLAIASNPWIKLVEQPEYKRRWNRDAWVERLQLAAKEWLLDRIEQACQATDLTTCAQLADRLRADANVQRVADVFTGQQATELQGLVSDLVATDQVPQMVAERLVPAAMPKFRAWQETWDKQRQEDAIDAELGVDKPLSAEDTADETKVAAYQAAKHKADAKKAQQVGHIPVPPQYKQPDFRRSTYWQLRGKLDVPKERFFSLPGCEKGGDTTLVIGWAGLNHLQRAQAIAGWYEDRKENDGWEANRLIPMLVALDELIPWLKQWHNDIDPEFGERMGDFYEGYLFEELRRWELTRDELSQWQPAAATSGKRRAPRKAKAGAAE